MFDSYAEIFEQRALSYHSAMKLAPKAREEEFFAVVEPLEDLPDGLVCDMPSGGCYLAPYVAPRMRYVGVEPVEDFVRSVEDPTRETLKAPITAVPLPSGSVSYVISLAGLHHEQSLAAVFAEMRRLVRPAGRVILADVAIDTGPARFLNGFVDRNNPMGHEGRFLDEATAGLLEAAGLNVLDDRILSVPWRFNTVTEAGTFCSDLFGVVGLEPSAVAEAMANDIGVKQADGQVRVGWSLRRIVCEPR